MRVKIVCRFCPRAFYTEFNRNCHMLFGHTFMMPVCNTGIADKIYADNLGLIIKLREIRKTLTNEKTLLKRRFLRDNFGRKKDMHDVYQNTLFNTCLESYHSNMFSRIVNLEHYKYDEAYKESVKLLVKIEDKGLILG